MRTELIVSLLFCASHVAVFSQSLGLVWQQDFSEFEPYIIRSQLLDSEYLLVRLDGIVEFRDLQTNQSLQRLEPLPEDFYVRDFAYNPDWIAAADRSEIVIWERASGAIVERLSYPPVQNRDIVRDIAMHPQLALLSILVRQGEEMKSEWILWNAESNEEQMTMAFDEIVSFSHFLPDDELLLVSSGDTVFRLDLPTAQIVDSHPLGACCGGAEAISPNDRFFVSGAFNALIHDLESKNDLELILINDRRIFEYLFSPDSSRLLITRFYPYESLEIWSVADQTLSSRIDMSAPRSIDFTRDGDNLLMVDRHGVVKLWNYGPDPQSSAAGWEMY